MQKAIFLDRDGTIIKDVGYIDSPSMVSFFPYTIDALRRLQEQYMLFIVTNQSGISKGLVLENDVIAVNEYIEYLLGLSNIRIYKTFYCPHITEDNCRCKKPSPYFINKAADLFAIDLSKSYIIGDHPSDIECGINAAVTPIYLLSGHGEKHRDELKQEVSICKNLLEASELILSTIKK